MKADGKSRFRAGAKVCSLVIMILLVIAALGPAKWAPRTELGGSSTTSLAILGSRCFSVSLGRGRLWSGESYVFNCIRV
jgi:hypothetical protein